MPNNPEAANLRRILIFDFDGVVVESEQIHFDSWNAAFHEAFGARIPGDYTQVVGLTLDELLEMWISAGHLPVSVLEPQMQAHLLARKTHHFFEIGDGRLRPIAGSAELVRRAQAQGWYTAIASRGRRLRLLRTLEVARFPAVFELVLGSEDIVDAQTDRKVHSRAAHILNARPADCVVIEDSSGGILDACDAGIGWVIGLTTSVAPADLYAAGANQVVSSLDEIILPPKRQT